MYVIVVKDYFGCETHNEFTFGHALSKDKADRIASILNEGLDDYIYYYKVEPESYKLYKWKP